jgi:predicted lipoprotein with Yx(FWY)xxD motif
MKTSNTVWIIVVIIVIVLGGWYLLSMMSAQPSVSPSASMGLNGSPNQTNTGQPNVSPVVTVSTNAVLGDYLVASNGMTLYRFTKDTANKSNCSGQCIAIWPPYSQAMNNPLVPGSGVTGKLATITRADGSMQLTYKGVPLYFYSKDTKPGDTNGQNVLGIWFVVKP